MIVNFNTTMYKKVICFTRVSILLVCSKFMSYAIEYWIFSWYVIFLAFTKPFWYQCRWSDIFMILHHTHGIAVTYNFIHGLLCITLYKAYVLLLTLSGTFGECLKTIPSSKGRVYWQEANESVNYRDINVWQFNFLTVIWVQLLRVEFMGMWTCGIMWGWVNENVTIVWDK